MCDNEKEDVTELIEEYWRNEADKEYEEISRLGKYYLENERD